MQCVEFRKRTHHISAGARLGCSWVAGRSTHGWVGQGSGYLLKDALSPNGGHGAAPPLSRRSRVQRVRLRSVPPRGKRERSRVGDQPHCPPQQQRRGSRTRGEGSWIGPLWPRPNSRRPSPVIRPLSRESPRERAGARTFSQPAIGRSRCEYCQFAESGTWACGLSIGPPLVPPFCE